MKLRKKKHPVKINSKETHADHKPKVLWSCGQDRRKVVGEQGVPWRVGDRLTEGLWDLLRLLQADTLPCSTTRVPRPQAHQLAVETNVQHRWAERRLRAAEGSRYSEAMPGATGGTLWSQAECM